MTNWNILREVAEHIKPDNFDMRIFAGKVDCKTIACIAGHVVWIKHPAKFKRILLTGRINRITVLAREELDITEDDSDKLFFALNSGIPLYMISKNSHLVPDALRWMIKNEKISWDEALKAVGFKEEERP